MPRLIVDGSKMVTVIANAWPNFVLALVVPDIIACAECVNL